MCHVKRKSNYSSSYEQTKLKTILKNSQIYVHTIMQTKKQVFMLTKTLKKN